MITITGLLFLVFLLNNPHPIPFAIDSSLNLSILGENQKIIINGTVTSEFHGQNSKTIILNGNTKIFCPSCTQQTLKGKNLSIIALVEIYNENKSLTALSIEEIKNYSNS